LAHERRGKKRERRERSLQFNDPIASTVDNEI
jgi:hypothetical protein